LNYNLTLASLAFDQSRAKVVPTLWAWDQRALRAKVKNFYKEAINNLTFYYIANNIQLFNKKK